jgi:hypothetical protein
MIELSILYREHHERIPWAGIFEVGFGKIRAAIGVGMKDADEVEAAGAGGFIGG